MTLELAVRAAVLLAVAAVATRVLPASRAAARHTVWRVAMTAALLLPALGVISPAWPLLPAIATTARPAHLQKMESSVAPEPGTGQSAPEVGGTVAVLATVERHALWLWLAGVAAAAVYFAIGYLQLRGLRRRASPAPPGWATAIARLAAREGLRRTPMIAVAQVAGPLVTGLRRPVVLLPPDAVEWHDARREAVLIHELAHVGRGDVLAQLAGQAVAALHWFNPLAWYGLARMRRERELACDDEVLRAGVRPLTYAEELLAIAASRQPAPLTAAALSMARASELLEGRLVAVLDGRPRSRSRGLRACVSAGMAAASIAVAGVRLTPVEASSPEPPAWTEAAGSRWTILPEQTVDPYGGAEAASIHDGRDVSARERAALALGISSEPSATAGLLRALADPDAGVREKAAIGLAWRRDPRVGPALVAATTDPDSRVREKALVALAFSGTPQAGTIIARARTDVDERVRDKARKLAVLP